MISDVLFDAIDKIEGYLDDPVFAGAYSAPGLRERNRECLRVMDSLRAGLDTPPSTPDHGKPAVARYWESQMLLAGMPADFDFRLHDFTDGSQVEPGE